MPELTPLDLAHAQMENSGGDDAARLGFFERLADCELFLLLAREQQGNTLDPQVFPADGANYVLVFDREERLAEFAGSITPYAALSGRAIAGMLAGQEIGLGVNLGVAPSSILVPSAALEWLAQTVAVRPVEAVDKPLSVSAPRHIPEAVLKALDSKLALAGDFAQSAYLVAVEYEGGRTGHLLGIVDALEPAQNALTKAVSEALIFSGVEQGEIDVAFFKKHDPFCAKLAKAGLRFDLPQPQSQARTADPAAPGMDPNAPPRLI